MNKKTVPFNEEQIRSIIAKYPTPFHIYDEKAIVDNVRKLIKAFDWAYDFKEYFADVLYRSFIVSLLVFKSFKPFCVYFCAWCESVFQFDLHVVVQFSQNHLLKRLSFSHFIFLSPL